MLGGAATAAVLVLGSEDDSGPSASEQRESRERAKARRAHGRCKQALGPLLERLHELDSRLDVGLNYDEYTTEVGDVRVAYDGAIEGSDDPECLTAVGLPAEAALNQYAKAAGKWTDCFDAIDCELDSVEPTLRRYWDKASASIDAADQGLEGLRSGS